MDKENLGDYHAPPTATPEQLELARALSVSDDIKIDDDARISEVEPDEDGLGGGYWIQAWVWVPTGVKELQDELCSSGVVS